MCVCVCVFKGKSEFSSNYLNIYNEQNVPTETWNSRIWIYIFFLHENKKK